MHPSEKMEMNRQLDQLLVHIDASIVTVTKRADEMGIKATEMFYMNGELVMAPLVLAKAQALNAKVQLNIKEK